MKKFNKTCLITLVSFMLTSSCTVLAQTNNLTLKTEDNSISFKTNENDLNIPKNDLNSIKSNIKKILNLRYDIMKTWNLEPFENIIKSDKLLLMLNKSANLDKQWFEKCNLKIKKYESFIFINNIIKISDNKYIVNVSYNIEFSQEQSDIISKSLDEKYRFELEKEGDNWYITKLLDLNEDENKLENSNEIDFNNYNKIIDSKIEQLNYREKNMDKDFEEISKLITAVKEGSKAKKRVRRRTYSEYKGYNHELAVNYAHQYAKNRNIAYHYIDGADCTNFVSQCAYAAGIPKSDEWYPIRNSKAWNSVTHFFDYMIRNGYGYAPEDLCKTAKLGDIVQFYNPASKNWTHSMILSNIDDKGLCYCAHSRSRYDYPIFDGFIDGKYTKMRVLKFY